ncbi:MAG: DUF6794 domain-containing protein [Pyrinomonadaceae bacterium]
MRVFGILVAVFVFLSPLLGQTLSTKVETIKVYSQNEEFYLESIPYDHEEPTLPGVTRVYRRDITTPIYTVDRGFDSVHEVSNNLILSNDGQIIFYIITWSADEKRDGLKSISIYKNGHLVQSYTVSEITGCNLKKERCDIRYSNYDEVVDQEASNLGTTSYKKVYKKGIGEQEKFLHEFAILSFDDYVYIIDSKKNVHRFSLAQTRYLDFKPFAEIYEDIKPKARSNRVELTPFDAPIYLDFPQLRSGEDTYQALAKTLGMKVWEGSSKKDYLYRTYVFTLSGYLRQDGSIEIEKIDIPSDLPKEKIVAFFSSNRFVTSDIPSVFAKWYLDDEYFFFRKANDALALKEGRSDTRKAQERSKNNLVAETIEGRYIPANLGECFPELDKMLDEVVKYEILNSPDMGGYHHSLGMGIRNNWGLWGSSRLQKYFSDRGVSHAEYMSGVILNYYWEWVHGNKDAWREWEKDNLPFSTVELDRLPSALLSYSIPKWSADKNVRIEDAYKWLYQATRGAEHAVSDEESARKWLDDEWKTLDKPGKNEPIWEPLCSGGEIGRLNLRPFKAKGGKKEDLLEAFLASSRALKAKQTSFVDAWSELGKRLKKRSIGNLDYAAWSELAGEMGSQDFPAIHHSKTYEKAKHPAYRILTSWEMKKLLALLK